MEQFVYREDPVFNQATLDMDRVEEGLNNNEIFASEHPEYDLQLLKYSQQTYYDWNWTPLSVFCRGVVIRNDGTVVARPFHKFFNHEQLLEKNIELPGERPHVLHKHDGFMFTAFYYDDSWHAATTGALDGPHVERAQRWIDRADTSDWPEDRTFIFEFLSSSTEFQIVVPHDEDRAVLLAARRRSDGQEWGYDQLHSFAREQTLAIPERFEYDEQQARAMTEKLPGTQEGFVLWYPKSNVRTKIKGETYLKLHKLRSNMSPKGLHDLMTVEGNVPRAEIAELPDEFYDEADRIAQTLERQYEQMAEQARSIYRTVTERFDERSDIGQFLQKNHPDELPMVFALIDDNEQEFKQLIYDAVEPSGDENYSDSAL